MAFKDIFGKPNEGIHSYRVAGYAVADIILTFILAFVIMYFFMKHTIANFIMLLLVLFIVGEIIHWVFGVNTKFMSVLKGTSFPK